MVSTSPYDLIQSAPPEWRPQEDRVASAFVGISFFLFLETLFEIFRVFKKRRGLYFWSLLISVIATAINNIAVVLKYLVPGTGHIWPLYTLMALSSWTCFTLGQLTILYSRLHLVDDSRHVQRLVLYVICACAFFFIVPSWVVVWPAWNTDPELTKRWSPPDGIVERFTQLGFTVAETIVSGIYINALLRLLNYKPTVRQRRVFLDLVYVNVITIALDITSTVLVYLNQTGVSHPVQIFSYILKFRLGSEYPPPPSPTLQIQFLRFKFVVLNQLMAVAARGLRRETFGEKRYHNDSIVSPFFFSSASQEEDRQNLHAVHGGGDADDDDDAQKEEDSSSSSSSSSSSPDGRRDPSSSSSPCVKAGGGGGGETEISIPAPVLEEGIWGFGHCEEEK
ncbi:MAG: hypothetical protein Q9216_006070 [Gyalolechia sp. 2 TL-2023]